MKPSLSVSSSAARVLGISAKELLPDSETNRFIPTLLLVLVLTFQSFIHFELIFVYRVR